MKICLAIFSPVVILGSIAFIIILILRYKHKERLNKARKNQDVEYYTGDDLRITQPGDSTLRVSINSKVLNISLKIIHFRNFCKLL